MSRLNVTFGPTVRNHLMFKGAKFMKTIKELLFTPTGIAVTLLHVCFFVGVVTMFIGVRVYVLGDDPATAVKATVGRK